MARFRVSRPSDTTAVMTWGNLVAGGVGILPRSNVHLARGTSGRRKAFRCARADEKLTAFVELESGMFQSTKHPSRLYKLLRLIPHGCAAERLPSTIRPHAPAATHAITMSRVILRKKGLGVMLEELVSADAAKRPSTADETHDLSLIFYGNGETKFRK
jgi:hypothetical protein